MMSYFHLNTVILLTASLFMIFNSPFSSLINNDFILYGIGKFELNSNFYSYSTSKFCMFNSNMAPRVTMKTN